MAPPTPSSTSTPATIKPMEESDGSKVAFCTRLALRLAKDGRLKMSYNDWAKWFSDYLSKYSGEFEARIEVVRARLIKLQGDQCEQQLNTGQPPSPDISGSKAIPSQNIDSAQIENGALIMPFRPTSSPSKSKEPFGHKVAILAGWGS